MRELNARIRVALRHHGHPADGQSPEFDVGDLHLDLVHCEASRDGRGLELTRGSSPSWPTSPATPGRSAPGG